MKKSLLLFTFSLALIGRLAGVVVTTTADSGAGSLRQAITDVNANLDNSITFNIPQADAGFNPVTGTWKIVPLTVLPALTKQVTIDGTTQPFANIAAPIRIEISGEGYTFNQAPNTNTGSNLPFCLRLVAGSDGSVIQGLAINRFVGLPNMTTTTRVIGTAIRIETSNNIIRNNYLGTNIDGRRSPDGLTQAEQTRANSVSVDCFGAGAFNNIIGGSNIQDRNIIAGSRFGLGSVVLQADAHDNFVIGNYINVDVTGQDLVGQTGFGAYINKAHNNVIGGEAEGEGNVIAGCTLAQIAIFELPVFPVVSLNNKITGNLLGTNVMGDQILGTQEADGILINSAANGTVIKNNLISGNNRGIYVFKSILPVEDLVICQNKIGSDLRGKNVLGNKASGIHLDFNINARIKNNLIVGNLNGIVIDGQTRDTKVVGNCIDKNRRNGIQVGTLGVLTTQNTVIGGCDAKDRNIIIDNGENGILLRYFSSQNTTIKGNSIGADKNGTCDGNNQNGIEILCTSNNLVKANVIKGNGCVGVLIDDQCAQACETDVRFKELLVRNPATGGTIVVSGLDQLFLTIGAFNPAAGTYLALPANFGSSWLDFVPLSATIVAADPLDACSPLVNGAQIAGNIALVQRGVCGFPTKVKNCQDAGARAVIVFNSVPGLFGPMGGVDLSITIPSASISLADGTLILNNLPSTGTFNIMKTNIFPNDIQEKVLAAVGNTIVRNSIFDNKGRGIALGRNRKKNDRKDSDCGPNRLQNHPVLTSAVRKGCKLIVKGKLCSVPNTTFNIELFDNDKNCNQKCITEGKIPLDIFPVTTDNKGFVRFEHVVKHGCCKKFKFLSATATRQNTGDTSEFSKNQKATVH